MLGLRRYKAINQTRKARVTFLTVEPYSPEYVEVGFSEVGYAIPAKTLINSAVGQPLGEQFLRPLGPPAGFIS
jgi:hypothetical protein